MEKTSDITEAEMEKLLAEIYATNPENNSTVWKMHAGGQSVNLSEWIKPAIERATE